MDEHFPGFTQEIVEVFAAGTRPAAASSHWKGAAFEGLLADPRTPTDPVVVDQGSAGALSSIRKEHRCALPGGALFGIFCTFCVAMPQFIG